MYGLGDWQDTLDSWGTPPWSTGPITDYPGSGGSGGSFPPASSSTSIWDVINSGIKASSNILGTRYAVPQLNPGQYIQTGPNGSVMYQQQPGQGGSLIPSSFSLGSSGGLLIPMLVVGGVILMFASRGK